MAPAGRRYSTYAQGPHKPAPEWHRSFIHSLGFGHSCHVGQEGWADDSCQSRLRECPCPNSPVSFLTILQNRRLLSVGNFAADDARQAIRCISYHDELRCVATATRDNISIWEFDEYECKSQPRSRVNLLTFHPRGIVEKSSNISSAHRTSFFERRGKRHRDHFCSLVEETQRHQGCSPCLFSPPRCQVGDPGFVFQLLSHFDFSQDN